MNIDKSKFMDAFRSEAEDYVTMLNQGLVQLEKTPDDPTLIEHLFRAAHTLKGCARLMDFQEIHEVAHMFEDLFGLIKDGRRSFQATLANMLFQMLDNISHAITNVAEGKEEKIPLESIKTQWNHWMEHDTKKDPPVSTNACQESETPPQTIPSQTPVSPPDHDDVRVPMKRINNLLYLMGEIVVHKVNTPHKLTQLKSMTKHMAVIHKLMGEMKTDIKQTLGLQDEYIYHSGQILRASQEAHVCPPWLNHMYHIETVMDKITLHLKNMTDTIQNEVFHLNPVIEELQHKMKEIRMLPCSTVFQGFPRLVRDVACRQNKEIHFTIHGEDTEIDKKVLERIKGPLIHLLRNAIDHGIESKVIRTNQGKKEYGDITLRAEQKGDRIIITVSDDGQGIDLETIKTHALKKHLVTQDDLSEMSDEGIMNIIFRPGFSTAAMITDMSGRGVGMDVVSSEITALKGDVMIHSVPGQGTTITISLPLTIAILDVLLVQAGGISWAIPKTSVLRSLKIHRSEIIRIQDCLHIRHKNQNTTIYFLHEVLGLNHQRDSNNDPDTDDETLTVLIIHNKNKNLGLIVDKLIGEDEVFIKNLGDHLSHIAGVSGATVLASGDVVVILDPMSLRYTSSETSRAVGIPYHATDTPKKHVLIVEDSLTTRELEKAILESSGYDVVTAIDGYDALTKLTENVCDVIVSDIQMPRMDGFELCRNVKHHESYQDIPFVFVTSLAKDEEKRKGMDVGAQAYIVKSQFDQNNLLETLERLLP